MTVSVVILVLNDATRAAACIESIAGTTTLDPEIVVVANGTQDSGLEPLSTVQDARVIRLRINVGFARGCAVGAAASHGESIVFLNDDTRVRHGWLEALCESVEAVPGAGAAGSMLVFADGRVQDAGGVVWNDATTLRLGWGEAEAGEVLKRRRGADYVSGSSMLVPRSVWEELGGFDSRYFPAYYEDADFCMRLRSQGYRVVFEPASVVEHDESASTGSLWRSFIGRRNRSLFRHRWALDLMSHEPRALPHEPGFAERVALAVQRAQRENGFEAIEE